MTDDRLRLAVVVPNRNDAQYLGVCLDSVLGQHRPPDEIIFVDDQSTDDSVARARSRLSGCAAARIVQNPVRLGTNGALNVGLGLATSQYIFFLSSNDFMAPDLLARAAACLRRFPFAGIWSALMWDVNEHGDRRRYPSAVVAQQDAFFPPAACGRLAYQVGSWFTTMIFDRAALLEIGGFDASLHGLSDLFAALVLAGRRGAAFSPVRLGRRRIHGQSLLSSTLGRDETLAAVVQRFQEQGKALAPNLFTPRMIARTELRLHFASIRASRGGTLPFVVSRTPAGRRAALTALLRLVPSRFDRIRLGIIFGVLRPFDLLPTIRYRLLGSLVARLRDASGTRGGG